MLQTDSIVNLMRCLSSKQIAKENIVPCIDMVDVLCGSADLKATWPQVEPTITVFVSLLDNADHVVVSRSARYLASLVPRHVRTSELLFRYGIDTHTGKIRFATPFEAGVLS